MKKTILILFAIFALSCSKEDQQVNLKLPPIIKLSFFDNTNLKIISLKQKDAPNKKEDPRMVEFSIIIEFSEDLSDFKKFDQKSISIVELNNIYLRDYDQKDKKYYRITLLNKDDKQVFQEILYCELYSEKANQKFAFRSYVKTNFIDTLFGNRIIDKSIRENDYIKDVRYDINL